MASVHEPDSSKLAIQAGSTSQSEFNLSPLEPTLIIEGNPVARALNLTQSEDGLLSCGLWDCTAGKFKYFFACDEIVHILEGEVTVEDAGAKYTLRPGDVAFFPKGSTTCWTVPRYVRKFCIHRSVDLSLMGKLRSRVKAILGRHGAGFLSALSASHSLEPCAPSLLL